MFSTRQHNNRQSYLGKDLFQLDKPKEVIHSKTDDALLSKTATKKQIENLSSIGIHFEESVVKSRCMNALPYDKKHFNGLFDSDQFSVPKPKVTKPIGRHSNRHTALVHSNCHLTKRVPYQLKPIKRKILQRVETVNTDTIVNTEPPVVKFQEEKTEKSLEKEINTFEEDNNSEDDDWFDFLISKLSENTARWVVHTQIKDKDRRERMIKRLNTMYGPYKESDIEILMYPDKVSDDENDDENAYSVKIKKPIWKKENETFLDRVRKLHNLAEKETDPYGDETSAAFYRLPAGIRKAKKKQSKEEEETYIKGASNMTAKQLEIVRWQPKQGSESSNAVNLKAGKTMLQPKNQFIQEWMDGISQVYNKDKPDLIVMSNDNYYKLNLKNDQPKPSETWYPSADNRNLSKKLLLKRGSRRWKSLPEQIDDEMVNVNSLTKNGEKKNQMKNSKATLETTDIINTSKKDIGKNSVLVQIVDDWREKYHLDMRYSDADVDDIIRDMADIHFHIRLKAITTCARAAEYKDFSDNEPIDLDKNREKVKLLPERLFIALECLLSDDSEEIRRASAIALFILERPSKLAHTILRKTLKKDKSVDRWTAAQCLAFYGECDSDIVGELIWQLLNCHDTPIRQERARYLLAKQSENSLLVQSMLGEKLNSFCWQHRVIAAKTLPSLSGKINLDLVNKLTQLMWSDWHHAVRKTAAQVLGRTGHGKDVHDELRRKILNGTERERVDAISKIGQLGIMTAKLLPAYLSCFQDEYVSVRIEACVTASSLRISDTSVFDQLHFMATYDPIWRVKALAIQALGIIGVVNEKLTDCLLWAMRFENKAGVRAEACRSLKKLGLLNKQVADIMQARYLVEDNKIVRSELEKCLELMNIGAGQDIDMVTAIKQQVKMLTTKNNVAAQISVNIKDEKRVDNMNRLIAERKESNGLENKRNTIWKNKNVNKIVTIQNPPVPQSRENTVFTSVSTAIADQELQMLFEDVKRPISTYTWTDDEDELVTRDKDSNEIEGENRDVVSYDKQEDDQKIKDDFNSEEKQINEIEDEKDNIENENVVISDDKLSEEVKTDGKEIISNDDDNIKNQTDINSEEKHGEEINEHETYIVSDDKKDDFKKQNDCNFEKKILDDIKENKDEPISENVNEDEKIEKLN